MVNTYTLTIHLHSGDKVYYNLSRAAVKRYFSYFREFPDCYGYTNQLSLRSEIQHELNRTNPNWSR
jgi:hypothetical protein